MTGIRLCCIFIAGTLLAQFTSSGLHASSERNFGKSLVEARYAYSQRSWKTIRERASRRNDVMLNDDGSVSFFYPSYKRQYLTPLSADLDALCDFQVRTLFPRFTGLVPKANPKSLRSSGYMSECLGIPHVPEFYSTEAYYTYVKTSSGVVVSREPASGENIARIACFLNNRLTPPISQAYKQVKWLSETRALIIDPEFKWNKNVYHKRRISVNSNLDAVCRHFGFDRSEGPIVADQQTFFNARSVVLDDNQRVNNIFDSNTKAGEFIKEITCAVEAPHVEASPRADRRAESSQFDDLSFSSGSFAQPRNH